MKPKNFLPREEYLAKLDKKHCAVTAVIRNPGGKILLVKTSYQEYWTFPGGSVDENESPVAAVGREVQEELGIELKINKLISLQYLPAEDLGIELLHFVFDGGILSDEEIQKIKADGEEILEIKFVTLGETQNFMNQIGLRLVKVSLEALSRDTFIYNEF